jgi:hypothetical protein
MSKNRWGLIVGCFLALTHAVWSLAVAIMPSTLTAFVKWILDLHHLTIPFTINPFVLSKAITLIALTFVFGYIYGWILAMIFKLVAKRK